MKILAIDPGNTQSAWLLYDSDTARPVQYKIDSNKDLLHLCNQLGRVPCVLAIEMMACYGMPVGRAVFETCVWIGRFVQAWGNGNFEYVYRKDVKLFLCNSYRAKDSNIRQSLIDRYGGKQEAIGLKATPGPLYGISKDIWSALAIAVYRAERL